MPSANPGHCLRQYAAIRIGNPLGNNFSDFLNGHHPPVVSVGDASNCTVLAYTGTRIGAVARLHLSDYRNLGEQRALRFREKGGKEREIPARHDLEGWINDYVATAGIGGDALSAPLFRAAAGKKKGLTRDGYKAHSIRQMLKRRLVDAGLPELFSPHSFRVTDDAYLMTAGGA